jgi:hypothetical protein
MTGSGRGLMARGAPPSLPYGCPFTVGELLAIEEAICVAWKAIWAEAAEVDLDEVGITSRLEGELGRMMNHEPPLVEGFTRATFETPVRGGELESFDGKKLEKRPDMVIRRAGLLPGVSDPKLCGLFVECKIVDKSRPMSRYAGDGLVRFVNGTYAWAVSFAMMLGYARVGYALPAKLRTHLARFGAAYETVPGSLQRRSPSGKRPAIWETRHARKFAYRPGFSGRPGEIVMSHLWPDLP